MPNNIEFIGYNLFKCNFSREYGIQPSKMNLSITNVGINPNNKIIEIEYKITFEFKNKESMSEFLYKAGFYVEDDVLMEKVRNNNEINISEEEEQLFTTLSTLAFPFIRQSIHNVTNDAGGAILLPIIDARNLKDGIELIRNNENDE